ncbi:MAG: tetratricopeptide repeat protein [Clostridiales bacterium]|nr:tetratricopeptide repeat protein [Clostridiales bacterium]
MENQTKITMNLCCGDSKKKSKGAVPVSRIIEKLDEHLGRNDYAAAERHLKYWLNEAEILSDDRGAFAVINELIGIYRKCGNRDGAIKASEDVLRLTDDMGLSDSVGGATAYVNAATAYKCFGEWDRALTLYEKARAIYERELPENDGRLGGLYNNMALASSDAGKYDEALQLFEKALKVMGTVKNGELEQAITYLNMAELEERRAGLEDGAEYIYDCLEKAEKLLKTESIPQNGYYAFVAEKCAPTFDYYGWFGFAEELKTLAERIRSRI